MMLQNALLRSLVEKSAAKYPQESNMKSAVSYEVEHQVRKSTRERNGWFYRHSLPRASVLARLPRYDRKSLLAHFHAKEMRNIADATHCGNHYDASLARKRLERVDEMAKAFTAVDHERLFIF